MEERMTPKELFE